MYTHPDLGRHLAQTKIEEAHRLSELASELRAASLDCEQDAGVRLRDCGRDVPASQRLTRRLSLRPNV